MNANLLPSRDCEGVGPVATVSRTNRHFVTAPLPSRLGRKLWLPVVIAVALIGCGSVGAPEKSETKVAPAPHPVKDNTALLLTESRVSAAVVPDHVLGNKALPGGTVGEYSAGKDRYQLFVIETPGPQDAAILLLDWKGTLTNPDFDAGFGGYFGSDAGKPVFAFTKGKYLAGVAGLDRKAADPVARLLAARIR